MHPLSSYEPVCVIHYYKNCYGLKGLRLIPREHIVYTYLAVMYDWSWTEAQMVCHSVVQEIVIWHAN